MEVLKEQRFSPKMCSVCGGKFATLNLDPLFLTNKNIVEMNRGTADIIKRNSSGRDELFDFSTSKNPSNMMKETA